MGKYSNKQKSQHLTKTPFVKIDGVVYRKTDIIPTANHDPRVNLIKKKGKKGRGKN